MRNHAATRNTNSERCERGRPNFLDDAFVGVFFGVGSRAEGRLACAAAMTTEAALSDAVVAGRSSDVEALLKELPDACTKQPWGDEGSLLHLAAGAGHAEVRAES